MLKSAEVKEQIAKPLAGGQSQTQIASTPSGSQSSISPPIRREDVKALVKRKALKFLEMLPNAVRTEENYLTVSSFLRRLRAFSISFFALGCLGSRAKVVSHS